MDPADCPPDSTCGFLAFTVSPLLGNLFAISLFLAPLPRVLAAVNSARLDGLNVLPYPLIAGNCLGWLLYGLFLRDSFLVLPNAVGLLTGLYYVASVIPLQPPAARKITTNTLILSFLWLIVGAEVAFVLKGPGEGKVYMGSAATGVLLVFFASPLSSLFEVSWNQRDRPLGRVEGKSLSDLARSIGGRSGTPFPPLFRRPWIPRFIGTHHLFLFRKL